MYYIPVLLQVVCLFVQFPFILRGEKFNIVAAFVIIMLMIPTYIMCKDMSQR